MKTNTIELPRLLDQAALAQYLGKSTAWCERARLEGNGVPFVKLGRHVRYKAEDVLQFVNDRLRTSTSDEGRA